MGGTYAKGKYAVGQCARSGRKMLRKHMVRDGYYPDLVVDPAWYEPPDPQERFVSVDDPIAIPYPAPDLYVEGQVLTYPVYDVVTGNLTAPALLRPQCFAPTLSTSPRPASALVAVGMVDHFVLSWVASPDAGAVYNVYQGTSSGGESLVRTGVVGTSVNLAPEGLGTNYFIVRAANPVTGLMSANSNEASAALSPFLHRRLVTIDHTKVAADQVNFPFLFSGTYPFLRTTSNGGEVQSAQGYDIVFSTDPGGLNILPFEMDTWDQTTGACSFWVLLPTNSASIDTSVYLCDGSATVNTDQQNKAALWNGYFSVWHCNQDGGTSTVTLVKNSVPGGGDLSFSGGTYPAPAAGKISRALDFGNPNSNTAINTPGNAPNMPIGTTPYTFSLWAKSAGTQGAGIAGYGINGPSGERALWYQDNNDLLFDFDSCGARIVNGIADTNWHHLAGTFPVGATTAGQAQVSRDGVSVVPSYYSGGQAINLSPAEMALGHIPQVGFTLFFSGLIDEVRFGPPRDANWATTEYANQNSPSTFYSVGPSS